MPKPNLKATNVVLGYKLTNHDEIEDFVDSIKLWLKRCERSRQIPGARYNKELNIVVSVTLGHEAFQPLVDCSWAAAALPMSPARLRDLLATKKHKFHPAIYKRVRHHKGIHRVRLLTLDDLKTLRGLMLLPSKGKQVMAQRGDIHV